MIELLLYLLHLKYDRFEKKSDALLCISLFYIQPQTFFFIRKQI